jgi:hypothetical protein
MRVARSALLVIAAVALAACTGAAPGWTYAPAPSVTPPPSVAPSDGTASEAPSGSPGGTVLELTALNIAFDKTELTAPADTPFQIVLNNDDNGIPHNVEIKDGGTSLFTGEIFNGVDQRTYDVPALPAKAYQFLCTVHPTMAGTLTVQ